MGPIENYLMKHGFRHFEPKAVLFDMDGVLYDSMANHAEAWQQAMGAYGYTMTLADAYATEGARGIDTIRRIVNERHHVRLSEAQAQQVYDEKTRRFHAMKEAPVMPGVRELMALIKEQGLTIGVVTGSGQRPLIQRLLTDFSDFVDEAHLVTAYDVSHGKPSPEPYLQGMWKTGTSPRETIVVENAPLGVRAGVAAGAFTIAVNTGPLADEVLTAEGADLLFSDMPALAAAWQDLLPQLTTRGLTRDDRWRNHYEEVQRYIAEHKAMPSKHRPEDYRMVNWLKYNRKLMNSGRLTAGREARFRELLSEGDAVKRRNQYSYVTGELVTPKLPDEQ